jgi:hypothetical protein
MDNYHLDTHLLLDEVVTLVNINKRILGLAVKQAENRKSYVDKSSIVLGLVTYSYRHILASFVIEYGGRLAAHAHAFLLGMSTKVVQDGRHSRRSL